MIQANESIVANVPTADSEILSYADLERLTLVPRPTLRGWVSQRRIPHVRLGPRSVRFERKVILLWLAERRIGEGAAR